MAGKIVTVYRKKPFKKRVYQRKPKVNAKLVQKMVKREIARNIENKQVRNQLTQRIGSYPANFPNFSTRNVIDTSLLLRNIGQGSGQGQRIGNHIKLKNMTLNCTLFPSSTYTKPILVKMWIVSDRLNPCNATATDVTDSMDNTLSQPGGTFFENGNTTSGLLGNLFDLSMTTNKDRFRLFKTKIFKLGVNNTAGFHNNDYKLTCRYKINLTKYMNKLVKYQDSLTTPWYNRRVFVIFSGIGVDDIAPTFGQECATLSYTLDARYEDA